MKRTPSVLCAMIFVAIGFVLSCGKEDKFDQYRYSSTTQMAINPNGDSELALLMRALFDEAMEAKSRIKAGDAISWTHNYEDILTAHATEPEKAASQEYKAFASIYIQTMDALKAARPDEVQDLYDHMVQQCMACHRALCPGPIVRIKKLE